jgi:hypothetical protein
MFGREARTRDEYDTWGEESKTSDEGGCRRSRENEAASWAVDEDREAYQKEEEGR